MIRNIRLIVTVTLSLGTVFWMSLASAETSKMETELDFDCETLYANYLMNLEEIEKLTALMATDDPGAGEVSIRITSLGAQMGAGQISSPDEMLVVLEAVKTEHEKVLKSCGDLPRAQRFNRDSYTSVQAKVSSDRRKNASNPSPPKYGN